MTEQQVVAVCDGWASQHGFTFKLLAIGQAYDSYARHRCLHMERMLCGQLYETQLPLEWAQEDTERLETWLENTARAYGSTETI